MNNLYFLNNNPDRIYILDGAYATQLQSPGDKAVTDVMCLSHPEIVKRLHLRYLTSGADIISTNTFNARPSVLAKYGIGELAEEINRRAIALARHSTDTFNALGEAHRRYVAGILGSGTADDTRAEEYRNQAAVLIEGGADMLILETVYSLPLALESVKGIRRAIDKSVGNIPLAISMTVNPRTGVPHDAPFRKYAEALAAYRPDAYGINCSGTPADVIKGLPLLAKETSLPLLFYPNVGMPDSEGNYRLSPEEFAKEMLPAVTSGLARIAGGCCGASPEFIAELYDSVEEVSHPESRISITASR